MTTLWFVAPVYFDVESFLILRERLIAAVAGIDLQPRPCRQFVVVDDTAGRDVRIADLAALEDTRVVTPPFNLGHQRALVYGLRAMSSTIQEDDLVVTLDADGEDRPDDLPRLIAPILAETSNASAVALARRTSRQESLPFKVFYFFFRVLFRTLTGVAVRTGNYAAYRGQVARRTLFHPSFDLCYSSTFLSLDIPRHLVPCPRGSRYAGESKMNPGRLATHGLRMLMPFVDRIATRALGFFVALFILGSLASVVIFGIRIFTDAAIPGWTTYTVLSLGTLSLLALGNFVVLFAVFSQSRLVSAIGKDRYQ